MAKGWHPRLQAFVQHYGSEALDAANLLMPLVFFLSPTDPRMLKTLDAIHNSPRGGLVSNSLVYRYNVRKLPMVSTVWRAHSICAPSGSSKRLTRAGQVDRQARRGSAGV